MGNLVIKLLIGSSLDGKVTTAKGQSSKDFGKLLTPEMAKPIQELREWADIVIVSRKTILYDNSSLKSERNKKLIRAVIDRELSLDRTQQIFDGSVETIIFTTKKVTRTKELNYRIVTLSRVNFFADLETFLQEEGLYKVLFEGGGNFNSLLIKSKIVSEIIVAHFPFIVGGITTPTIVDGPALERIDDALRLELTHIETICNMVVTHYKIIY